MPYPLTWGICCPGPSLWSYPPQEIIGNEPKYLIAVNGAILLGLPVDYWAVQDIEVFQTVSDEWRGDNRTCAILWIPDRWLSDIPEAYDQLRNFFNTFKIRPFPSEKVEDFNQSMTFLKQFNWREYTMFMAIALAIKHGAKIIELYGADMFGSGYGYKKLENERTQHTERRWLDERTKFGLICQECEKQGIQIIRKEGFKDGRYNYSNL